jgi:GNAT superfamily N-acetyltransferase
VPDLLVKLYDLPDAAAASKQLAAQGVVVRAAMAYEKRQVVAWVAAEFGAGWASECDVAFSRSPISCVVATESGRLAGFACHDATSRNFFGPMGVAPSARGRGIGGALLLECLAAMRAQGYAYAIIGGAGSNTGIYRKVAGATEIPGSSPGIYRDRLSAVDKEAGPKA